MCRIEYLTAARGVSLLLAFLSIGGEQINGQGVKGDSVSVGSSSSSFGSKTNSGVSSFRQNIISVQNSRNVEQQQLQLQQQQQQQQQQHQLVEDVSSSRASTFGAVDGVAGVDFPSYTSIPNTKFSCSGLPFEPGLYADESTGCQVYHMCYQGRRESFLCGIGTLFNQAIMTCDFWYSVECSKSSQFYNLNADFGKGSPEPSTTQRQINNFQSSSSSFKQAASRPVILDGVKGGSSSSSSSVSITSSFSANPRPPPPAQFVSRQVESTRSVFSSGQSGKTNFGSTKGGFSAISGKVSPARRVFQSIASSNGEIMDSIASQHTDTASLAPVDKHGAISLKGSQSLNSVQSKPSSGAKGDDQSEWKPYFKSKKPLSPSLVGQSSAITTPQNNKDSTSNQDPNPTPIPVVDALPKAEQEPNFSPSSSSQSESNSESGNKPAEEPAATTTTTTTTPAPESEEPPPVSTTINSSLDPATDPVAISSPNSETTTTSGITEAPSSSEEPSSTVIPATESKSETTPVPEVTTTTPETSEDASKRAKARRQVGSFVVYAAPK